MKNLLFIFLLTLISCYKVTYSEPMTTKGEIIYRYHEDARSEYTYHYGYSAMGGGYKWHWGTEEIPAKNIVKYIFLNDTIQDDNQELYGKQSNIILITYKQVFHDSVFVRNSIIKIQ